MNKVKKIILGVTGSIAAYKSADILRRLREKGFSVSVVMTKEALRFVTPLTFASLSEGRVYTNLFEEDPNQYSMPHIELARNADLILIAPATANTIAKMACGLADDLLTCIVLASKAPVIVAPAMNSEMYHHQTVQENCLKLKKLGMIFVDSVEGKLACGTTGEGHIANEETIVNAVVDRLK